MREIFLYLKKKELNLFSMQFESVIRKTPLKKLQSGTGGCFA